jgi:DNA-binding transcriptional regulator YiaG
MTPADLVTLRKDHGLTQAGLAAHMGTTQNTVARWETGAIRINEGWVRLAFEVLDLRAEKAALLIA